MRRRFEQFLALPLSFFLLTDIAAAQAITLDVIGIKPGMPANEALQALKADNPRLKLTSATFKYEGLANPLTLEVDGNDTAPTANAAVQQASERVQILLTTAPGREAVWSVSRSYTFPTGQRPSMQTAIEALRQKYGPESVPAGPPNSFQRLAWVYDAQAKPMGPGGARLATATCASTLAIYNGDGARTAMNADIQNPRAWPPECTSVIIVNATVQGVQISSNTFAASALDVTLQDGGRYRRALEATRGVILNAVKARQEEQAGDVNKRPAPKL